MGQTLRMFEAVFYSALNLRGFMIFHSMFIHRYMVIFVSISIFDTQWRLLSMSSWLIDVISKCFTWFQDRFSRSFPLRVCQKSSKILCIRACLSAASFKRYGISSDLSSIASYYILIP